MSKNISKHKKLVLGLVCVFTGVLGLHRFIVGKFGTGFLMLITLGGLTIWYLIDCYNIFTGTFTDGKGKVVEDFI